ncbi:MAG: 4-hydroxybenzoate octaprenyltransferase [Robiginitomaculum sp.]
METGIKDVEIGHWVNRAPDWARPYLQLSRLDRPIGYWLLALPGWIGLAFASLSRGFGVADLKWAALILIGAIAMRGAGCTYNDIVDQDLDAQVARTAMRPLPAGTVTTKQAWVWVAAQCAIGLMVLLTLPRLAQIIALGAIPLVAAYPFMKRITYWPQLWLGLTFNWAVLVAYAAKTGEIPFTVLVLYAGLIFWTIGYDTIYACQDIEDDAFVGIKSTARRFGKHVKWGVGVCYTLFALLALIAMFFEPFGSLNMLEYLFIYQEELHLAYPLSLVLVALPAFVLLGVITKRFNPSKDESCLKFFKSNFWVAMFFIIGLYSWTSILFMIGKRLID